MAAETKGAPAAPAKPAIARHPTPFKHVFLVDVADNGQLREVAIVKEHANGSLSYVDIALLDMTDKGRLKKLISGQHADKYQLWELMDQETLSNGKNALDYFHQMVKTKAAPGHVNTNMGGGLADVPMASNRVVGSNFTDTSGGSMNTSNS